MYIFSSFEYSAYLELSISELEQTGINREKILVIPLDKRKEKRKLFDSINYSDGVSLFDAAAVLGTMFMVLGVIYGYILRWGPIVWGLIGLFIGIIIGLILDFFPKKGRKDKNTIGNGVGEVIVLVNCENDKSQMVESILWNSHALAIGRFDPSEKDVK